jgi:hypothetical protein
MAILRTAPGQSGLSENSVVPSFDCPVYPRYAVPRPRTLRAVHNLNPAPPLVHNRKTLSQIELRQPTGRLQPRSAVPPTGSGWICAAICILPETPRMTKVKLPWNFA